MRRRRDDDSFANSTQCDASSQVDALSQADLSQADASQTESKADSMRTRPARKRRRTLTNAPSFGFGASPTAAVAAAAATAAASGVTSAGEGTAQQPLQRMMMMNGRDANSLVAGGPGSGDEQSLTSESADGQQLQVEMARTNGQALTTLEVVCRSSPSSQNGGGGNDQQKTAAMMPGQLHNNHVQPMHQQQLQQQQNQTQYQMPLPQPHHHQQQQQPPTPPAAFAMNNALQPIPPFMNGQHAARDDSVIHTSYSRPSFTESIAFQPSRQRSNSLPNEFDADDNAMDTS